ncbi:MAG TPA: PilZ domain-containing protein [Candidatus Eisenbacteria bacterium]|nr:PilZ domain-containing protein [Candidatus Eisenbacteria bacterium]
MNLQALLVSSDDSAADVLARVLPDFGIVMDRSSDLETTIERIQHQKFDALIVDFDDAAAAKSVLDQTKALGLSPLSIALVADTAKVRQILSGGAHFVLYKPVSEDAAKAALRAAAAMLNRERRKAFRVPVQAPVEITLPDTRKLDGILLDLSETGMDVLTAEPQVAPALLAFHFKLPDGEVEVEGHGQVAWANPNGQTGVQFLDLQAEKVSELKAWLRKAAAAYGTVPDETVPHCKLTDLSLGGCYVETDAPFPEGSLIDFCLRTKDHEVHADAMVRVAHPGHGMGVEFPSRTAEQRQQVENVINFLRSCPGTMPDLDISPKALVADLTQFEHSEKPANPDEEMEDPLLDLLRRGASLQQEEFLSELQHQRNPEAAASV